MTFASETEPENSSQVDPGAVGAIIHLACLLTFGRYTPSNPVSLVKFPRGVGPSVGGQGVADEDFRDRPAHGHERRVEEVRPDEGRASQALLRRRSQRGGGLRAREGPPV